MVYPVEGRPRVARESELASLGSRRRTFPTPDGAIVERSGHGPVEVSLRQALPDDAEAVAAIYAPWVRDTRVSLEVAPPTTPEMASRIAATNLRWPWLVAEDPRQGVLGYAYGGAHRARSGYRWTVEVSAYVAAAAHRRGVARRLYVALLGVLDAQGYRQAVAGIGLPNEASIAFHEAMGFHHAGTLQGIGRKFDDWQDVGWWQRSLGDGRTTEPLEPTPVDALPAEVLAQLLG